MTADTADHGTPGRPAQRRSVEELARQQGVRPIETAADLVCDGIFETDEELDAFLADLYALRHSDAG